MTARLRLLAVTALAAALAGCHHKGDIVVDQSVGITALRTTCPAVGIPDYTGNITLFSPPEARTADAIDVEATMTDVRTTCDDSGPKVFAQAHFDVLATRTHTQGARTVQLPFFSTVLRGGSAVVTKRVGTVTLSFALSALGVMVTPSGMAPPARPRIAITRSGVSGNGLLA